jgi:hypothetical protein
MSKKQTGDGCNKRLGEKGSSGYMGLLSPFGDDHVDPRPGVGAVVKRVVRSISALSSVRGGRG